MKITYPIMACIAALAWHSLPCKAAITTETYASADVTSFDFMTFPPLDFSDDDGVNFAAASAGIATGSASGVARASRTGGSVIVNAFASTAQANVSATSRYYEDTPDEYFIEGIWATSGGGSVSITGIGIGGLTGQDSFRVLLTNLPGGLSFTTERDLTASAFATNGQNSYSCILYVVYPTDEPYPGLPGERANDPVTPTPAPTPILEDDDQIDFETSFPTPVAGTYLSPIVGGYGRNAPLYLGTSSSQPLASLTESVSPLSLQAASLVSPEEVAGYRFDSGDNFFTSFTLPTALPNGDGDFTLLFDDESIAFSAGDVIDFTQYSAGGVDRFFLADIDGGIIYDPNTPMPFVAGLQFASDGFADITVVPYVAVPEPGSVILCGLIAALAVTGKRRLLSQAFAFTVAAATLTDAAQAEIVLQPVALGQTVGHGYVASNPPASNVGSGSLGAVLSAAVDYWESKLEIDELITIRYGWTDLSGEPDIIARADDSIAVFDNSFSSWFIDSTPYEPNEFLSPSVTTSSDPSMGNSEINVGNNYNSASVQAFGSIDLFSTAVHELGHSLGLGLTTATELEFGDFVFPLVDGHLTYPSAALWTSIEPGERNMLSTADIFATAAASGNTIKGTTKSPVVSTGDFYNRNTWSGGFPPDSLSTVLFAGGTQRTINLTSDATSATITLFGGDINLNLGSKQYTIFGDPNRLLSLAVHGSTSTADGSNGVLRLTNGILTTPDAVIDGNPSNSTAFPLLVIEASATLNVETDPLLVGSTEQGRLVQRGDLQAGGVRIGAEQGAVGLYEIHDGADLFSTGLVYVGHSGTGELVQSGGVISTASNSTRSIRIGENPGSRGTYTMTGGTVVIPTGIAGDHNLYVGQQGDGFWTIDESDAQVEVRLGGIVVGNNPGSYGDVVQDDGELDVAVNFCSGRFGQGHYLMRGGSLAVGSSFIVSEKSNSEGYFEQSGGAVFVSGVATVGADASSDGELAVIEGVFNANGGLRIGTNGVGLYRQTGGNVNVQTEFAVARAAGDADNIVSGTATLTGGTTTVLGSSYIGRAGDAQLTVDGGALITDGGHLRIAEQQSSFSQIDLTSGLVSVRNNRDLYLGSNGEGAVFHSGGLFHVSSVTELGLSETASGTYFLDGEGEFESNQLVVGTRGIGLFQIDGGHARIAEAVTIARESGSVGNLAIFGGRLEAESIEFGAGDGVFDFFGGHLAVDTFNGDLANEGGVFNASGFSYQGSQINGDYSAEADSSLSIGLVAEYTTFGDDIPQHISFLGAGLTVNGALLLNGVLSIDVADLDLQAMVLGQEQSFLLATASQGISGEFDRIETPLVGYDAYTGDPLGLTVDYRENELWLELATIALAGDYDGNGFIDTADYQLWRSSYGGTSGNSPADGNRDGVVDAADYTIWRDNLGLFAAAPATLGADATTPVPEPSGIVLLAGIAALGITRFQSRHVQ